MREKRLVRRHKEIKDQELRETFYLLTRFIRISEERSGKAVKIEVARGLVKEGVSAHVISRTTNLSVDEYDNDEKKISIPYKVGQRIKEWRLRRGYTQEDLASKVGIINQRIYEYEQGRAAVSLEMLDEIAKVLLINITDLLPETRENENSEAELSRLIEEYKKIKSQELRNVLIKSLFESMQVCKEKVSIRSEVWFKKQQLAGFEKGLIPFVSKSDTTKLSAQEIYSLALTVQNMNSYDRQHNAVSVAQHGYSLMEYSLGHPKMSTSLTRIL